MIPRLMTAVFALCVLAGGNAGAESVLHRGNSYEPASLDPHKVNTVYENNLVSDLFEGLTAYDAAGKIIPGMAKSWDVSADGKTYTFHLREGLQWSDGAPITAEDVVFSFRRLMKPETAAVYAQLFYLVKNGRDVNTGALPPEDLAVHAPDAATVEFELNGPAPYFPQTLANGFFAVVPRHAIGAHGDKWSAPGNMVSNGAFVLEAWEPQDHISMVRNERFHDAENVALDRVMYYPTQDTAAAVARFRAGGLDIQMHFPPAQAEALREMVPGAVRLSPSLLVYYLTLNTTVDHLKDVRVRRALSLAIDREILAEKVVRAGVQPAFSFVPPATAGHKSVEPDYADAPMEARRREARRLLEEAGYGPDNPLEIEYAYTTTLENRRLAVVIAAMWKRVGVQTSLLNREGKVHFSSLRLGDFEVGFVGWSADYNDPSSFLYVLQSTTVNANYSRYDNPDYDALMVEAGQTVDVEARAELLRKAEVMMLKDQPIVPLYFGVSRYLVATHVQGWVDNAMDVHLSRYLSLAE